MLPVTQMVTTVQMENAFRYQSFVKGKQRWCVELSWCSGDRGPTPAFTEGL